MDVWSDIAGGGPGRFVSNVLARVLIFVDLCRVDLKGGPGEGDRLNIELEIKVRVRFKV